VTHIMHRTPRNPETAIQDAPDRRSHWTVHLGRRDSLSRAAGKQLRRASNRRVETSGMPPFASMPRTEKRREVVVRLAFSTVLAIGFLMAPGYSARRVESAARGTGDAQAPPAARVAASLQLMPNRSLSPDGPTGISSCTESWDNGAGTGLWRTATNWSNDVLPGASDEVCIGAGFPVTLSSGTQSIRSLTAESPLTISAGTLSTAAGSSTTAALSLSGAGVLTGAGNLRVSGLLTWSGGTMSGPGTTTSTTANDGLTISSTAVKHLTARTLVSNDGGTWSVAGTVQLNTSAVSTNNGSLDTTGNALLNLGRATPVFNNVGTFRKLTGTGTTTIGVVLNNTGNVLVQSGTLNITRGFVQTTGGKQLSGGNIGTTVPLNIDGGSLSGSGTITGNVSSRGDVYIGSTSSAGSLRISRSFVQSTPGTLHVDIGGTNAGVDFDQLSVTGAATLVGKLDIQLTGGLVPGFGQTFAVKPYSSRTVTQLTVTGLRLRLRSGLSHNA